MTLLELVVVFGAMYLLIAGTALICVMSLLKLFNTHKGEPDEVDHSQSNP